MTDTQIPSVRRELFRYARVAPPKVVDLKARLAKDRRFAEIQSGLVEKSAEERARWARDFLQSSDAIQNALRLEARIFDHLEIETVPDQRLPCRTCIGDRQGLSDALAANAADLKEAQADLALALYAALQAGSRADAEQLSRHLQFLELLPRLGDTIEERAYAPLVLSRHLDPAREDQRNTVNDDRPACTDDDGGQAAVLAAWDISHAYIAHRRRAIEKSAAAVRASRFTFDEPALSDKLDVAERKKELQQARARQYRAHLDAKKAGLGKIREEREALKSMSGRQLLAAATRDAPFVRAMRSKYGIEITTAVDDLPLSDRPTDGFCAIYTKASEKASQYKRPEERGCNVHIENPCLRAFADDRQQVAGQDDVRPLGIARLITVEEQWLTYHPGEISAVETVLGGELRLKESKTTRYFEEESETRTTETLDKEAETTTTTETELSTQIEQEIATRFSSDVNAEASGSGGGTIGVVDFEGAASLGANVGVGVDTSLSSSTDTSFAQEIVSRAVERTKRVSTELRRQRSYRLFETTTSQTIDNTGGDAANRNAVYSFLDREVCISERVYGMRQFLGAEIMSPGRDLLKQELRRQVVDMADIGRLPDFNMTPERITPENYMALVGKFRASNVSPPPPAVRMESRTYRTDTTNESREPQKPMVEKVADVLAPFFGEYKRFLIQDEIEIPEGYRIQEVAVTVTHGQNGVSIPAHLPFSALGAAFYAMPTLSVAAIPPQTFYYLPIALWQVLYTASPLMHYNADSSNMTLSIGHETAESPYFFFEPDELMKEVLDALGSSSVLNVDLLGFVQEQLAILYGALGDVTNPASLANLLSGLSQEAIAELNILFTAIRNYLNTLVTTVIPNMIAQIAGVADDNPPPALPSIPNISPETIAAIPAAIMAPFQAFFDAVMEQLGEVGGILIQELFELFASVSDNVGSFTFGGTTGFTGTLPVSLNCIALKPGVTVNLTACMVRIEEQSLDLWRLETFERLSQAYAQMEAEYAAKLAGRIEGPRLREAPSVMRQQEREVVKVRVIDRLHRKFSATPQNPVRLDELQLFEHAIDWPNVTYRVYNYGPQGVEVVNEALGLYSSADRPRRAFLDASWAQVLIPLKEDLRLEPILTMYIKTGLVDFEADLLAEIEGTPEERLDELTAIYRDLILQRESLPVEPVKNRRERIPTDLIVIYDGTAEAPYPVSGAECPTDDSAAGP